VLRVSWPAAHPGTFGGKMTIFDDPRYQENPIYLFFEEYIRYLLGQVTETREASINELNLQKIFNTKSSDWKDVIVEVLHLSDTFHIAVWDLWIANKDHFVDDEGEYDYIWFSQVFTDKFMEEDSKVDVWTEDALKLAKERIKEYHK